MLINNEIQKYLKGELFTNGLTVNLEKTRHPDISRENAIINIVRGKRVIHLGCSDHIQVIPEKIRAGIWLHKLITDNAASCFGIDIDSGSIEYLINELHYTNVRHGDITKDSFSEITENEWDFVVFGEIIEHLDNPVDFLQTFKKRFGNNVRKFIITVPNIYNKEQLGRVMEYKEVINSDHRFWFTPYTIAKMLTSAGFEPEKITYSNLIGLSFFGLLYRKFRRILHLPEKYPFYFFRTIIITGNVTRD